MTRNQKIMERPTPDKNGNKFAVLMSPEEMRVFVYLLGLMEIDETKDLNAEIKKLKIA